MKFDDLQAQIRAARTPLRISGHGSKDFYGEAPRGEALSTLTLNGITAYEPSELYISALAGTPIADVEAALAEQRQRLAFEPPRFGGTVMKNVAGFDVSRALAGSMGQLGLITEVTLKVLPLPAATATLRFDLDQPAALQALNAWGGQPLPIEASAWWDGALLLRLAGANAAVEAACRRLGGDVIPADMAAPFWTGLRDQGDEFFVGAQRWVVTPMELAAVREAAAGAGGHATLFRALDKSPGAFAPLSAPLAAIHRRLKAAFDPRGVFNPGRLYAGL